MTDGQIDRLFRLLSDSAKFQEVLWSVMQVIEAQGRAKHVDAFARNLAYLCDTDASEWAETMVCRNHEFWLGRRFACLSSHPRERRTLAIGTGAHGG